jgi:hypothetical protein
VEGRGGRLLMYVDTRGAWRTIAEAYGTPYRKRTDRQREITLCGLCWAYETVTGRWIYDVMALRGAEMGARATWWPYGWAGDANRAVFAGFLAAMTKREREAFFAYAEIYYLRRK